MAEAKKVLLTKAELVEGVSKVSGETKAAVTRVMDAVPQFTIDTILKNLPKKNEIVSVPVPGFGTLGVKYVEKQEHVFIDRLTDKNNPVEKKKMIPAHYVPTFKIAQSLKTELNPEIVKRGVEAAKSKDAAQAPASKKKPA
jgi:nucleoid DNA-binding protein